MRARDNPFATAHLHRLRYRLQGATWDELLDRLQRLAWRAGIVGPHGSGKTTLLETLADRLRERGFETRLLRLSEDHPRFAPGECEDVFRRLNTGQIVLLDGAEQMGRWAWHRFKRRTLPAGGLIITTHRSGRLPTLLTCETTPGLLGDVVHELLPDAPALSAAMTRDLFLRHQGNLREALRELYDVCAQQRQSGERAESEKSGSMISLCFAHCSTCRIIPPSERATFSSCETKEPGVKRKGARSKRPHEDRESDSGNQVVEGQGGDSDRVRQTRPTPVDSISISPGQS